MKLFNGKELCLNVRQVVQHYPTELLLGVIAAVSVMCLGPGITGNCFMLAVAYFCPFFVLTYTLNRFFRGRRTVYYLSFLPYVLWAIQPLLFGKAWVDPDKEIYAVLAHFISLLLLLVACGRKENNAFARDTMRIVGNLFVAACAGYAFYGVVLCIYASTNYIFDLKPNPDFFWQFFGWCNFVIAPLIFCKLQERDRADDQPSRLTKIVHNGILSPAIVVYTAILYIYFFKIIILRELPKGGVAYMVMALFVVSAVGHLLQLILRNRYFEPYYKHLHYVLLLPLVLFWVGTLTRICAYSLTFTRVYLLLAGGIMSLYTLLLLLRRINYRRLFVVVSAALAAVSYIPGITAEDIGVYAQRHRVEKFARELGMWDAAAKRLKPAEIAVDAESDEYRELSEAYLYLRRHASDIEERLGELPEATARPEKSDDDTTYNDRAATYRFSRDDEPFDISEYRSCRTLNQFYEADYSCCVMVDGKEMFIFDAQAHFAAYVAAAGAKTRVLPEAYFVESDSCMLVLSVINIKDDKVSSFRTDMILMK